MKKIYVASIVVILIFLVYFFDLGSYLSFEKIRTYITTAQEWYREHPVTFMVGFFIVYVIVATLPIPGEMTTTLTGGIVMGFGSALALVSFASTIGACFAMLTARYLFRGLIETKFSKTYAKVQKGFKEDGIYYVLMLRLIPVPFFIVNILLGLTPISLRSFYIISQIGMFPATALVAKAGAELGLIENPADIFSPTIVGIFIFAGIFPLLMKKIVLFITKKKEEDIIIS